MLEIGIKEAKEGKGRLITQEELDGWIMHVKKVEYFKDYKLKLLFSNGKTKIADIEPIIKESKRFCKRLYDIDYFKRVSLDKEEHPMSICWPNGFDICPDVLYDIGIDYVEEK